MTLSYDVLAVTVGEADAYAQARGWTNWTGDDTTVKTPALRRGQDYVASTYNDRWKDDWDDTNAPDEVKYAIIEAARRELVSPGSLDPDITPGKIKQRVRVEGAVDVTYATGDGTASSQRPDIAIIDRLLKPLLAVGFGGSVDILRV